MHEDRRAPKRRTSSRSEPPPDASDGRHQRGKASRARVIAAMVELLRKGVISPTADQVAGQAGVGQRTVFRHFADMESLYREIQDGVEDQILPRMLQQYAATDWRDIVREMTQRRIGIYEEILPFRTAADIKRFDSPVLMTSYRRHIALERTTLTAMLPEHVLADHRLVTALNLALSFQCWSKLREGEGVEDARAVLTRIVDALLGDADATQTDITPDRALSPGPDWNDAVR